MREHEFRGMDKLGKWHYGDLIHMSDSTMSIRDIADDTYVVDPESVGEYTGHTDTRGVRVYEGDIMFTPSKFAHSQTGVVVYEPNKSALLVKMVTTNDNPFPWKSIPAFTGEVVGNVYENSKMIEMGEEYE